MPGAAKGGCWLSRQYLSFGAGLICNSISTLTAGIFGHIMILALRILYQGFGSLRLQREFRYRTAETRCTRFCATDRNVPRLAGFALYFGRLLIRSESSVAGTHLD